MPIAMAAAEEGKEEAAGGAVGSRRSSAAGSRARPFARQSHVNYLPLFGSTQRIKINLNRASCDAISALLLLIFLSIFEVKTLMLITFLFIFYILLINRFKVLGYILSY